MKRLGLVLLLVGFCSTAAAQNYVNGYTRRDGTYVQGYYRTPSDGYFSNNYSTRGNYNPYSGEYGTRVTPYPTARDYYWYAPAPQIYQPYRSYYPPQPRYDFYAPAWGR